MFKTGNKHYVKNLPVIMAALAAIIVGIVGYARKQPNPAIYGQMCLITVVFYLLGLLLKRSILTTIDEMNSKKEAEERELSDLSNLLYLTDGQEAEEQSEEYGLAQNGAEANDDASNNSSSNTSFTPGVAASGTEAAADPWMTEASAPRAVAAGETGAVGAGRGSGSNSGAGSGSNSSFGSVSGPGAGSGVDSGFGSVSNSGAGSGSNSSFVSNSGFGSV
ncbi:MAG: hypothetical protein FWH55_07900, partial [Oscillospiraceae bacterium]|nr:hypothetical protein [Oscillospiraceae bacterium]